MFNRKEWISLVVKYLKKSMPSFWSAVDEHLFNYDAKRALDDDKKI